MSANPPDFVDLRVGETTLSLVPAIGGGVARFSWRGQDLFRPATAAALGAGDPLGLGCFPLVPFAGRIRHGRFAFQGRAVALAANLAGEPGAIHGQGWRNAWRLTDRDAASARLRFEHAAGDWPWDYLAEQTFTLEDGALTHRLSVTNADASTMPAGLGLHPYFPRGPDTRLAADIAGVFLAPDQPATQPPPAWDWRGGRPLTSFVDHQFAGWKGAARIDWPDRDMALTITCAPATPYLVVYAPDGQGMYGRQAFCVEPVSHRLDAVNRSPGGGGHGMALLAPGETLALTVRFAAESPRDREPPPAHPASAGGK